MSFELVDDSPYRPQQIEFDEGVPRNAEGMEFHVWLPQDAPEACPFEPGVFLLGLPGAPDEKPKAASRHKHTLDDPVPFGKHKGSKWSDVPDSYLDWMIRDDHTFLDLARDELERRGGELERGS